MVILMVKSRDARRIVSCMQLKKIRHITSRIVEEKLRVGTFLVATWPEFEKAAVPKKLGVNIIYLNPIFLATSNHRYDTVDYMKIDPMLGDEDDLRGLIHDLHQNGMHLY